MKGIILAGGHGTRLFPLTSVLSKHLLPVYDKPMIFYPFSILLELGIKDILVITRKEDINLYKKLFINLNKSRIKINFEIQENPNGLPDAFKIGKKFIGQDDVVLILGDNIFYGNDLLKKINNAKKNLKKNFSTIFCYRVSDPEKYGVIKLKKNKISNIIEKPKKFISDMAITGIYFFKNNVCKFTKNLKKSKRGEFEITDLLKEYLKIGKLKYDVFENGFAWLDAGSHDSICKLLILSKQLKRQGIKIACPEEIALRKKLIDKNQFLYLLKKYPNNEYKKYLKKILHEKI